jgi:hypothetical protein
VSLDHFETGDRTIHPTVTLKNGLRVANFSSPHPFTFDDGTILPACPNSTVESGKLASIEFTEDETINGVTIEKIDLSFALSDSCATMLFFLVERKDVDIVLVPLPVLECIKDVVNTQLQAKQVMNLCIEALAKCRVVKMKDRITKVIYSNRFCI